MLERLNDRLTDAEAKFIGICMLLMSVLALVQVIIRYVFFYSLIGLEECTRYFMIWMTLIGAGLAVDRQDHIRIDIAPLLLKSRFNIDIQPLINLVLLGFGVFFLVESWNILLATIEYEQQTPAMRLPMGVAYLCLFLSSILIIFHALVRILLFLKNKKAGA